MVHWAWLIVVYIGGIIVGFFICAMLTFTKMRSVVEREAYLDIEEAKKNKEGFTLVEIMVSIVIAMILLGGLFSFFVSQSRSYASNEVTVRTVQDSRRSVSTMVRDLRLAGYKTSASSFCGVVQATDKLIQVVSDLNQDGDTLDGGENITYVWNPGTEELTKNGTVFLRSVSSLVFQYTLQNGSTTSTPADLTQIRKVTMSITVKSQKLDPLTMSLKSFSLTSDVTPRNMGL
jgi:type IV pilus assembly protein PilW